MLIRPRANQRVRWVTGEGSVGREGRLFGRPTPKNAAGESEIDRAAGAVVPPPARRLPPPLPTPSREGAVMREHSPGPWWEAQGAEAADKEGGSEVTPASEVRASAHAGASVCVCVGVEAKGAAARAHVDHACMVARGACAEGGEQREEGTQWGVGATVSDQKAQSFFFFFLGRLPCHQSRVARH